MKKLLWVLFLGSMISQAQSTGMDRSKNSHPNLTADVSNIEVAIKAGPENPEMQTLYEFENINQTEFFFKGEELVGKYYVLRMKEFLNGDLINTATLFDERGNRMMQIDSAFTSFKLLSKIDKDEIKVWLRGGFFGSKQSYFPTTATNGRYVAKDFFGGRKSMQENIKEPFEIMAVITPSRNPDGSGSYCRVAQSEIDPEVFGKEFNIPHYYLIEIEFVEESK